MAGPDRPVPGAARSGAGEVSAGTFGYRLATPDDIPGIAALMDRAIGELQQGFLSPAQIAASRAHMGLDSQIILDGGYFLVEIDGQLAGCGGWSARATLFGGDASGGRNPAMLDPAVDAARIRAMYTDPRFARRGVGRLIIALCEDAARAAGFRRTEMAATLAGVPLYERCGYSVIERFEAVAGEGVPVPLVRMGKALH
ncbi:MAG: GNAT family N-acetyltransferase [Rhizorhabdus sp.]|nr:GNAT family N-acetyltransferase [Rhizorhabdus sp.]